MLENEIPRVGSAGYVNSIYAQSYNPAARNSQPVRRERTIFAAHAPGLFKGGYSPLPRIIEGGHGRPAIKRWSDYCECRSTDDELRQWSTIPNADISLACGYNGLVAIDVDDDEIIAAVCAALPHCTVARRGSKGFALLARHLDGPQKTLNIYRADENRRDPLVEIMGRGRVIAIPPSIHAKTGKPYRLIDPATGVPRQDDWRLPPLDQLPVVTAADIARLVAELAPWSRKPKPRRPLSNGSAPASTDTANSRHRAYAQAGLDRATTALSSLRDGRPTELFWAVCGLGWAVAHGVLGEAEFVNAFVGACKTNGLIERDGQRAIEASIRSGLQRAANDALPMLDERPRDAGPTASAGGKGGAKNAKFGREAATLATPATFQVADDPLPLYRELPSGEPFPVDALGETLGGMARALHEAAVRSPMAICATAVLAAAACATQGLRDIVLPIADGQAKPLSLFFLAIAQSGERKTATDSQALKPIHQRARELKRDYDDAMPGYRNAFDAWEAERKRILSDKKLDRSERRAKLDALGPEPAAPKIPILTVQEPTIEGLTKHLKNGYPTLGLFSSEGGQFIGGHAMSDDAKRRSAAALNALWDDGRLERIRASEDAIILPGRRVSVFLQAQPDVAQHFLADPILRDIGLLARFLITQPDTTMGSRKFRDLAPEHQVALVTYGAKMLALLRRDLPYDDRRDGLDPLPLSMAVDARSAWISFADHVETMLAPGAELHEISGFANKLPEHAARIAAVLQVFDEPDALELTPHYLGRGIALAEYYASEALRLHGAARIGVELREAEKLRQWLCDVWDQPHITVQSLQRYGPGSMREKSAIERLVNVLADHNWLRQVNNVNVYDRAKRTDKIARVAWEIAGRTA